MKGYIRKLAIKALSAIVLPGYLFAGENFETLSMFNYHPGRKEMACYDIAANEVKNKAREGNKKAAQLFIDYKKFMEQNEFRYSEFGKWIKATNTNSLPSSFLSEHARYIKALEELINSSNSVLTAPTNITPSSISNK